jgi:hypothetical protein
MTVLIDSEPPEEEDRLTMRKVALLGRDSHQWDRHIKAILGVFHRRSIRILVVGSPQATGRRPILANRCHDVDGFGAATR